MSTLAIRNLHFFKKPQSLSDYNRKIFSIDNYFGRGSYYKSILYKYINFGSYINIFNNSDSLRPVKTDTEIQPKIIGADTKKIITKYGKPVFTLTSNKLTIFVYKLKFNGLKTNFEIHFYNNTAFLINYHYSKLSNNEKDYILQSIMDKYMTGDADQDIRDSKIIDGKNNIAYIHDVLEGINITYLSSRQLAWYSDLMTEFNARDEKQNDKIRLEKQLFYNSI